MMKWLTKEVLVEVILVLLVGLLASFVEVRLVYLIIAIGAGIILIRRHQRPP